MEFNEGDVLGVLVYQPIISKSVVIFIEIQTPLFSLITNLTDIPIKVISMSFTLVN